MGQARERQRGHARGGGVREVREGAGGAREDAEEREGAEVREGREECEEVAGRRGGVGALDEREAVEVEGRKSGGRGWEGCGRWCEVECSARTRRLQKLQCAVEEGHR